MSFAFLRLILLGTLAASFALAGCGRKGPLDPPPAASLAGEEGASKKAGEDAAQKSKTAAPKVMDSQGRLITPPGPNRPLPIDVLLN